ncbi:hypothetical protein KFU94_63255, partial [Chloroflexi bacterium TSY]|nr:hypothetical protein [Chloroflexi bacterium TSY]
TQYASFQGICAYLWQISQQSYDQKGAGKKDGSNETALHHHLFIIVYTEHCYKLRINLTAFTRMEQSNSCPSMSKYDIDKILMSHRGILSPRKFVNE